MNLSQSVDEILLTNINHLLRAWGKGSIDQQVASSLRKQILAPVAEAVEGMPLPLNPEKDRYGGAYSLVTEPSYEYKCFEKGARAERANTVALLREEGSS